MFVSGFSFSKVIYLERKSRRVGGVHIYRKYVASFFVCEFEEFFFSGYHQEEPVTFFCVVGFFFVLLVSQDRYLAVLNWEDISRCLSDRRRSFSFVLLEGEGFVDFAPEVL